MQFFPDVQRARLLFGESASSYGPLINEITPYLLRDSYAFEDNDAYEKKVADLDGGLEYGAHVYWEETLARAHMASVSSIVRTCRWVEASLREFEAGNLFGWAASTRSLMEAAADSAHSLAKVPLTLAEIHGEIVTALRGHASAFVTSSDLEDALIHYTHARKIQKKEDAPAAHRARQSAEYMRFLTDMRIDGAKELYGQLCEYVHPAALSVSTLFGSEQGKWIVDPSLEQIFLKSFAEENRKLMGDVLMAGFNPALLTLRVLHRFDRFSKIPPLRKYKMDRIPLWTRIEAALR